MASPKAPAKPTNASDLISKITTVIQRVGFMGRTPKKAEPYSKKR